MEGTILMHIVCNAKAYWTTSEICDSIFCGILSQNRRHYETSLPSGSRLALRGKIYVCFECDVVHFEK